MGLIAAESNGKSRDTEALYREHGAAVARLCRSLLRDRGEAEDATQQVFLSAHRALLNGATPREPLGWLLAVARNECYARFRQRALAPIPAPETPEGATAADASMHAMRAGELENVWDEVGRMPPTQREAFLLREIRGLSYGQVADELSLSPPSVRSLLLRARARLRQRLGDVAAGLGGAPWIQALIRVLAGGEGASPLQAATKAAAVGVGALALAGGGGLLARHTSRTPAHANTRHQAHARVRHVTATPEAVAVAPNAVDKRGSSMDRSRSSDDGVRESSSGESRSRDGSGAVSTSGDSSSDGSHDGSTETTAVAQPTTDGHDGGGSTPSGSGSTSTSGSDGGTSTSGSSSGSDGGSTTTTTTTSSGSDGGSGSSADGGTSTDGGGSYDGHGG